MEKVVSNVEYTEELLKEFNRLHNRYSTRVLDKFVNVLATIIFICDLIILCVLGITGFDITLILANLIFIFLLIGINTDIVSDFATKMFLKSDKINLNSKALQTFTKEAVSTVDELTTSTIPYSKLYKVMETEKYIFYYLNKMQAGIVVKANNTAEEIEFISSTLKENVKKYIVYNK